MNIDSLKGKERKLFLQIGEVTEEKAKELLQQLGEECKNVEYEEDYAWINEAIIRWETYLKSEFGHVYLTSIAKPKRSLKRHFPRAVASSWPFPRITTQLFAHFVLTEPSSTKVATAFASLVYQISEGINVFDNKHKRAIRELAELADVLRRPCLRQLARFVINNVDDMDTVRAQLREYIDAQSTLPGKIYTASGSKLKELGIARGSKILLYGYSELMEPTLNAIPGEWRKDINVFVCECRFAWQRADGPLAEKTADDLNFPTRSIHNDQVPSLITTEKALTIFMSCRAVGKNGNDSLEVTAFQGSSKVCKLGSQSGAKVCILLAKRKILAQKLYKQKVRPLRPDVLREISLISSRCPAHGDLGIPRNVRIDPQCISFFLTEDGLFSVNKLTQNYDQEFSVGVPPITN